MKRTRLRSLGRRGLRLASDRRVFRVAVRGRAKGRCERCETFVGYARIDAHHRVPRSRGGDDDPDTNGAGLCRKCHDQVHGHTCSDWAEWFKPREDHDGH